MSSLREVFGKAVGSEPAPVAEQPTIPAIDHAQIRLIVENARPLFFQERNRADD